MMAMQPRTLIPLFSLLPFGFMMLPGAENSEKNSEDWRSLHGHGVARCLFKSEGRQKGTSNIMCITREVFARPILGAGAFWG